MPAISIFDIFKIGIGPSSSHTVGPMKAAAAFVDGLGGVAADVTRIDVSLHGSLAWTGKGHGSDSAVLLGLSGLAPETIDPDSMEARLRAIHADKRIQVPDVGEIGFDPEVNLVFDFEEELPRHTNGMRFGARADNGDVLAEDIYYSLGGGFIAKKDNNLTIAELIYQNETSWRSAEEVDARIASLCEAMRDCVARGLRTEGVLPGNMSVLRRAAKMRRQLSEQGKRSPVHAMGWVNAYAIAVNEENAAGGRVVTSPTNGAAGIIPAVLMYYEQFVDDASEEGVRKYLLTAGAIGVLYKTNASISGAEMGCQGEVGVACSMAAGGLAAALGGSNDHIEEAAEIGMEHNLGLTCDPIGGLVQIPCIERNAMGAVKAINAAQLAMHGDGTHKVTLDQVIETMWQTGKDMSTHYKETSQGGLAVNVPEC
jgi:L-serine dehydratase